jgi:hypothetical protein
MELVFEHGFPCPPHAFWDMFLSQQFNRAYWLEKTGAARHETLTEEAPQTGDRKRVFRVVVGGLELPAPLAKLLGGPLAFTEDGTFHAAAGKYVYAQAYSLLTDRISVQGTITAHPSGGGTSTVRVATLDVTVRLFGLGALAERAAESNFKWGFEAEAAFGRDWLAKHPPAN